MITVSTRPGSAMATPAAGRPTTQADHQKGGWTRSIEWSKKFPNRVERSETRASFPSTVARKAMIHAATSQAADWPVQNPYIAANTNRRLTVVTWFGVMPTRAQKRVTTRAGAGQKYSVTRSV